MSSLLFLLLELIAALTCSGICSSILDLLYRSTLSLSSVDPAPFRPATGLPNFRDAAWNLLNDVSRNKKDSFPYPRSHYLPLLFVQPAPNE
jgi:hypothetical protein